MPRTCSICGHGQRDAIDAALVANEAYRHIASRYGTSTTALQRHRAEHLAAGMVKAQAAKEVAQADDLLREVRALRSKAYSLLLAAEKQGDIRTALLGVREARSCLELLGKLLGELDDRPQVNLVLAPQWPALVAGLRAVLAPHPAILAQVAAHLLTLEEGQVSNAR